MWLGLTHTHAHTRTRAHIYFQATGAAVAWLGSASATRAFPATTARLQMAVWRVIVKGSTPGPTAKYVRATRIPSGATRIAIPSTHAMVRFDIFRILLPHFTCNTQKWTSALADSIKEEIKLLDLPNQYVGLDQQILYVEIGPGTRRITPSTQLNFPCGRTRSYHHQSGGVHFQPHKTLW